MKPDARTAFAGLLDSLAGYLAYCREDGTTTLEVNPDIARALGAPAATAKAAVAPRPPPTAKPAPAARPGADRARPAARPSPARAATPEPVPAPGDDSLDQVAAAIAACTACTLCETRTRTVPGQGCARPDILFVGEGPGRDEDEQGLAFVGAAGQLLTRMITAMGLTREEVFIANVVKCRPPNNRVPLPAEMQACLPFLHRQIALLRPRVIVGLGKTAVEGLLGVEVRITQFRGTWSRFAGIDMMPTYHPAFLLRDPNRKVEAWEDLKTVLTFLGRPVPPARKP